MVHLIEALGHFLCSFRKSFSYFSSIEMVMDVSFS